MFYFRRSTQTCCMLFDVFGTESIRCWRRNQQIRLVTFIPISGPKECFVGHSASRFRRKRNTCSFSAVLARTWMPQGYCQFSGQRGQDTRWEDVVCWNAGFYRCCRTNDARHVCRSLAFPKKRGKNIACSYSLLRTERPEHSLPVFGSTDIKRFYIFFLWVKNDRWWEDGLHRRWDFIVF